MRKGRFAGLSDRSLEAVAPPRLGELLLFDFVAAGDDDSERVAAGRASMIRATLPLLTLAHLLWSAILLFGLSAAGAPLTLTAALIGGVIAFDLALWLALKRESLRPCGAMRLIAIHQLAGIGLWIATAAAVASGPGGDDLVVRAALIAGAASAVPIFNTVPLLMLAACAGTLGAVQQLGSTGPLGGFGAAVGLFLVCLSAARARFALHGARGRMALEWQAKKARRFVEDFEASGRGWFWETNADGSLTYVSEPLAAHLGSSAAELRGRRFEEVLLVEDDAAGAESRRTLGFHLSARFPFSDVIVRAPASEEIWWSLSGSPNFDDYGRFLGFRGLGTNLSEQRRSEAETTKLARYDSLTGVPNRAMMRETLDRALANSDARRRGCALMMIDLDKFKQVNDTLGHPVGDKLLKQVARRLSEGLGGDGQLGRLGGDEFEAILPGVEGEAHLSTLARRLIEDVSRPYLIEGHEVRIGASIGISVGRPGKALAESLIKEADLALYAAKADGRGTFRFYDQAMHTDATERQRLEAELREALARNQLVLHYQPILDSVSEEVVAFEALLRWEHPRLGLVPPSVVVPLAEESGLMPAIGEWVIRTACTQAAKWPSHLRVAVNLSPSEFASVGLSASLTRSLAASGLDPERLELEISEKVFLAEGASHERVLAGLRSLGVRIVLDNFGTGHSGLAHLRSAPLDKIKIDQSFVRDAAAPRSRNAAIVRAIVVLAESLGMDTTAEGAETLEELALIRRLGCSQVQGFIFSKPVTAEEALVLARESRPSAEVAGFSRPPRHRLLRNGVLSCKGRDSAVRLRNISAGGAMVESDVALEPGTPVELDLDEAGRLAAEVRWCKNGQIGLKFAEAFELKALARSRPPRVEAGSRGLRPSYLDAPAEAAPASSPLAARKKRAL